MPKNRLGTKPRSTSKIQVKTADWAMRRSQKAMSEGYVKRLCQETTTNEQGARLIRQALLDCHHEWIQTCQHNQNNP